MAPRKARAMADLITGLPVNEAEAQLMHHNRRATAPLLKLLRSALANAKNNQHLDPDGLYIESFRVDQGPMLKRFLPRARGMATPIHKKMSNVTLIIAENLNLGRPRFKIVKEKKAKAQKEKITRSRKERPSEEELTTSGKPKRPNFFKRVFSRKSGFAK